MMLYYNKTSLMLYYNKTSLQLYCVAFVKKIIDILLVYSTVAIATQFLYYTLIDRYTQWLVILGFNVMRRFVALASTLSN